MFIDEKTTKIAPRRLPMRARKAAAAVALSAVLGGAAIAGGCADPPVCQCDAAITKIPLTPMTVGGTGTFGILIDYSGHPLCGPGKICIHDTLAPGLTFNSASPSAWSCTQSGQDVRCCFQGPLPTAHTALPMLTLTVDVSPNVGDNIKNCASIEQGNTGDFADADGANNTSCTGATVIRTDLSIKKWHEGTFVAGGDGVFDLGVSNDSSSPVSNITVTDVLDAAFTFVSASPSSPWSCSAAGQTVTCTFTGTLAPLTSAPPIQLTVHVNDNPPELEVTNCASVSSNGADPTPKNNQGCDTVEITSNACPTLDLDLSTGINNASSMPGSVGANDDSWSIVAAPNVGLLGPAKIVTPVVAWQPALPGSRWIGPLSSPTGFYTYQSCFCMNDGFSTPMLDLSILGDDQVTAVTLNACKLPGPPGGNSNTGAPVHVQTSDLSCFLPGMNCLYITVQNGPPPTSLDVAGKVTADNGVCCL